MLTHDRKHIPALTKGLGDGTLSRSPGRRRALLERAGDGRGGQRASGSSLGVGADGPRPTLRVRKLFKPTPPRRLVPRSRGPDVLVLQARLNAREKLSPPLKVDGRFGRKTLEAILGFQRAEGLVPSGMMFEWDWARLLRRNPKVHIESASSPRRRRSSLAETSVEERLAWVFSRAMDGSAMAEAREKLVGDERLIVHLAGAVATFTVTPAALEKVPPPHGFSWLDRHEFNTVVRNFADTLVFARSQADLLAATLLLQDLLAVGGAEWFMQFVPRKKRKFVTGDVAPKKKVAPAPAPRPAPRPKAAPEQEDIDQDRQAATLEAAADDGTPFCEECDKAGREREPKKAKAA